MVPPRSYWNYSAHSGVKGGEWLCIASRGWDGAGGVCVMRWSEQAEPSANFPASSKLILSVKSKSRSARPISREIFFKTNTNYLLLLTYYYKEKVHTKKFKRDFCIFPNIIFCVKCAKLAVWLHVHHFDQKSHALFAMYGSFQQVLWAARVTFYCSILLLACCSIEKLGLANAKLCSVVKCWCINNAKE